MEKHLKPKVTKYRPLRDELGRYVPFCDFGFHQGLIRTPEICEERNCTHFHRLYIEPKTNIRRFEDQR